MINRRQFVAAGLACSTLAGLPARTQAATKLRMNSIAPKLHFFTTTVMRHWQDEVQRATQGRVVVEASVAPLGQMPQILDLVTNGIADVSPGDHTAIAGRFELMQLAATPLLEGNAETVSVALWRTYQRYLADANEHGNVKVLSLWTPASYHIYSVSKPITHVADFEGLKVIVTGPVSTQIVRALGGTPVNAPISQFVELISRGVVDAAITTRTAVLGFQLINHIKHVLELPLNLTQPSQFLVMNQRRWDALDPADQQAITSVSGEAQSRFAGHIFREQDALSAEKIHAHGGIQVRSADAEFVREMRARVEPMVDGWLQLAAKHGVDGPAALAMFRALARGDQA